MLKVTIGISTVLGQGIQKTITGCISDNVTLVFDLPVNKSLAVDSYIWYKQALPRDPSFAKYKVADKNFQIFVDDVKGRLLHNHDDSSQLKNLVLLNVQKSDISKYVLVINYVNVTQQSSEYVLQLSVRDVCFEKPEQVEGCAVSACFTGENGKLTMNSMTTEIVNGFSVVKNCMTGITTNYSCCNAAGQCKEHFFLPISVLGQELKKTINACINDNVTLFFDLPKRKDLTVGSYLMYKYDVKGDPTFAKVAEKKLETLMDVVEGRLFIDFHDDSSQLKNVVLLNVQKNDVSNYILVINYTNAAKQSPEYVLELPVKDICFENPKEKDGCVFSTCFTGENGILMNNETGMTETVNGYKVISNCTSGVSVSYSCCNAAGECEQQMLKVPEPVEDFDTSDSDENGGPSYGTIVGIVFGALIGHALAL